MSAILTDDELVAIAVRAGAAWKGLLPTVSVDSVASLLRAAFRGNRSLVVRGLCSSDGSRIMPEMADAVSAASTAPLVLAFVAAENSPLAPTSAGVGVFPLEPTGLVIDVTLANGLHEITRGEIGQAQEVLLGMARLYQSNGSFQGAGYVLTMLENGSTGPNSRALVVSRDETTLHHCMVGEKGDSVLGEGMLQQSLAAAVALMLPEIESSSAPPSPTDST